MKKSFLKAIGFMKGLTLVMRPHILFGWLRHPVLSMSNTLSLSKWIAAQRGTALLDDFYTARRDYAKRYRLYAFVIDTLKMSDEAIDYVEFGVCGGYSFKWWSEANLNSQSKFYGFDTFEGLPENWGTYKKGEMDASIPETDDARVHFLKGLFQDTLPGFLKEGNLDNEKRKIIHLDADLFSSTLYVLTSIRPYLKKGDILIFDEFNVPNHEFYAFKLFTDSFYVKPRLLAAVNNYYQVAFVME